MSTSPKMTDFLRRCKPPFGNQNIVHFKQRYSWDCGLSCVLMVLPEVLRQYFIENFELICTGEDIDRSTWTIDLCYILKKFNINHNYFTKTLGVHSGYKGQAYYDRILHKDEYRIRHKFETACINGIIIECRSLSYKALADHLENHGPIILLIDANLLTCDVCKANKLNMELRSCLPWSAPYIGHYIVLCAHNEYKQKFVYRNPTFKDRLCVTSYGALEIARRSFGTDEDVILIFNRADNGNALTIQNEQQSK